MSREVVIRPGTADDFDDLVRIFEHVAEEHLWIGTEPGFDKQAYRMGWRRMVEDDGQALLVATVNEALIGSLSVHRNSERGCEIGMLVKLGHRGQGVGAALLREAIDWARQRNEASLSLLVFPHNVAAIALYKRYGFKEKQRYESFSKRQSGVAWDAVLMTLEL